MKPFLLTTLFMTSLSFMAVSHSIAQQPTQSGSRSTSAQNRIESGKLEAAPSVISAMQIPGGGSYVRLAELLKPSSQKLNGPQVLAEIRALQEKLGFLHEPISDAVWRVLSPNGEPFDDIYSLFTLPSLNWTEPLREYSAGDESGEEPIYKTVNRELRNSKQLPSQKTIRWVSGARAALTKLPRFEGISFRGTILEPSRIDTYYAAGKPAVDAAFVSTSLDPAIALKFADREIQALETDADFGGKVAVVFIVKGKTGRPVATFAIQHSQEEEILFANGTPMIVTSKSPVFEDSKLGLTQVIVLEE